MAVPTLYKSSVRVILFFLCVFLIFFLIQKIIYLYFLLNISTYSAVKPSVGGLGRPKMKNY